MSNGIEERQNEDKSIMLLAAQRQLYNEVGNWDIVNFILAVVIPCLLFIVSCIFPTIINLQFWRGLATIILLGMTTLLSTKIRKEKVLAATIQQQFDIYVYSMPWDKDLFGAKENLSSKILDYAKNIMDNNSERNKLRDWYSTEADKMPILKGIFNCQRENYHWDVGLRQRCRKMILSVIIVLIIGVFGVELVVNATVSDMLMQSFYLLPVFTWAIPLYKNLGSDIDRLVKIEKEISRVPENNKSMKILQRIQKNIYEHRKSAVKIPNKIYAFFRDNDEDKEHQLMKMD